MYIYSESIFVLLTDYNSIQKNLGSKKGNYMYCPFLVESHRI